MSQVKKPGDVVIDELKSYEPGELSEIVEKLDLDCRKPRDRFLKRLLEEKDEG